METLSVLPDGRIALCKMVHGTEITLVFQAKECPETLNKVTRSEEHTSELQSQR